MTLPSSAAVDPSALDPPAAPRKMEDVGCRACLSDEPALFRELEGYRFQRCGRCGLVYMSPRPVAESLEVLYDEDYFESTDPSVGYAVYAADAVSLRDKSARLLKALERYVTPGRLLDVGCAHGFSLEVGRERGWSVEGVEPAAAVARRVERELGVRVHHDLASASFAGASFDAVTMWDVVEHVPEPREVLVELRRILRDGGFVSVVTPDLGSIAARLLGTRWEEMRKMPEHIYFFDRRSLERLLRDTGFVPVEWGTVGKLMPLEEAARRMIPTSPGLWSPVWSALKALGLDRRVVYLDPRWKLSVVARAA